MPCNLTTSCFFLLLLYLTILYQSSSAFAVMLLLAFGILSGILHLLYEVSHIQIQFPEVVLESSQKGTGYLRITIKNTGKRAIQQASMKKIGRASCRERVSSPV